MGESLVDRAAKGQSTYNKTHSRDLRRAERGRPAQRSASAAAARRTQQHRCPRRRQRTHLCCSCTDRSHLPGWQERTTCSTSGQRVESWRGPPYRPVRGAALSIHYWLHIGWLDSVRCRQAATARTATGGDRIACQPVSTLSNHHATALVHNFLLTSTTATPAHTPFHLHTSTANSETVSGARPQTIHPSTSTCRHGRLVSRHRR